jgi:AraC-like DNA-binding protein
VITTAFITTLDALPDWPLVQRVTRERAIVGCYRHRVGTQKRVNATLQITLSGAGRCRIGSKSWQTVGVGMAMLYHAGVHHDCMYEVDPLTGWWEFLYVNVGGAGCLAQVLGLVAVAGHVLPVTTTGPRLKQLLGMLPREGAVHRSCTVSETSDLANAALGLLAQGHERRAGASATVAERALVALSEAWLNPPAAERLAQQLGVSREHLVRSVRAATGLPPALWLRRYRVQRAADLLLTAEATVAGVASTTGFATASHFVRVFTAMHGETPAVYRRRRVVVA